MHKTSAGCTIVALFEILSLENALQFRLTPVRRLPRAPHGGVITCQLLRAKDEGLLTECGQLLSVGAEKKSSKYWCSYQYYSIFQFITIYLLLSGLAGEHLTFFFQYMSIMSKL
ncbi:hypothetical protein CDAR_304071 [Caerostris darwini]|uniref:Uncharacterized protein n=1 Tax=Caerostris darwini TaxID=1538125 RepID=A0AAV4WA59_9ARAC|nr:hypothetical protein CDAR_304071 [Caerostris darwini]